MKEKTVLTKLKKHQVLQICDVDHNKKWKDYLILQPIQSLHTDQGPLISKDPSTKWKISDLEIKLVTPTFSK